MPGLMVLVYVRQRPTVLEFPASQGVHQRIRCDRKQKTGCGSWACAWVDLDGSEHSAWGQSSCAGFNTVLSANPGSEAWPFLRMDLAVSGDNTRQRCGRESFFLSFLSFSVCLSVLFSLSLSLFLNNK